MSRQAPLVSTSDQQRLSESIGQARRFWVDFSPRLESFQRQLASAPAVRPHHLPAEVITMNSRFSVLDFQTDETFCYTLVYPEHEAPDQGRLCALSPMGMALLGARPGDIVRWDDGNYPRSMKVLRILYQPEAAGHTDL